MSLFIRLFLKCIWICNQWLADGNPGLLATPQARTNWTFHWEANLWTDWVTELPDWCSHDTIVKSKLGHVHICIHKIKLLASNSVHGANFIKYNIVDWHTHSINCHFIVVDLCCLGNFVPGRFSQGKLVAHTGGETHLSSPNGAQFLALDMECHLFNGKGAQTCAGG